MSSLAWLDTSSDDERRMREIVKMFSDASTLDDLGIGQVRDTLADLMFPGTSTVHARPRYFLIVPWLFERAAAKHSGTLVTSKANDEERKLIEVLRDPTPVRGMIGAVKGAAVQNLPSNIYWSALQRYQILTNAKTLQWNVTVPPPTGFPKSLDGGLNLTADEATWLRERILSTAPDTYLAHLLSVGLTSDLDDATMPWDHPALATAPPELQAIVSHAELFSLAINGAALLYNLLVAERFDTITANTDDPWAPYYTERLAEWADDAAAQQDRLIDWDLDEFWATVHRGRSNGRPVSPATTIFISEWVAQLREHGPHALAAASSIRQMVTERERKNKGEASRLNNDKSLRSWQGSSGSARLNYRWPTVQTLLFDIAEGLADAAS